MKAPDLIEPTIIYRQFLVSSCGMAPPKMRSVFYPHTWDGGEQKAKCGGRTVVDEDNFIRREPKNHAAPHKNCTCGFYGYYERKGAFYPLNKAPGRFRVAGATKCWGRVIPYANGLRVEKVQIVTLATAWWWSPKHKSLVRQWADAHGVPVVPGRKLKVEALKHGKPLPPEMVPDGHSSPTLLRQLLLVAGAFLFTTLVFIAFVLLMLGVVHLALDVFDKLV